MNFLLAPLNAFAKWIIGILLAAGLQALRDWYAALQKAREQKKINEENLKRYEEAIENKLPDEERRKRAQDLLNGSNT